MSNIIATNFRKSMTEIASQHEAKKDELLVQMELAQSENASADILEKLRLQAKGHDTKAKRLKALSEMDNKSEKLLREHIKTVKMSDDEVAQIASYGLDKVIQLCNALASDKRLTMTKESDNKRNIAIALDYMDAKKCLSINDAKLQRELGHSTTTQAGYIRRVLVALKVAEQVKDADLGLIFTLKNESNPIMDKIKSLYAGIAEAMERAAQQV